MWYHYDITFALRCQEVFEKSHSTGGCMKERATDAARSDIIFQASLLQVL